MMKPVRTRFAPSPSGFLHVGGARTALFNYLYARARGGQFILRMEDTDRSRSTEESFQVILESLQWLGIDWDEGPQKEGKFGPYVQSQRLDIYQKYTEQLLQEKKAYRCFCSLETLAEKKQDNPDYVYDRACLQLSESEIHQKLAQKQPFSVRIHNPDTRVNFDDLIQGQMEFDSSLFGDFIIVKSDGFPTYNYAVVIDDALMAISHVIRGVGHLTNTPRQILLYQALGFTIPEFAHASEIVGSDGKKLSKRAGATSVLAFRDLGYLPQCFANYIALLGWTPEDQDEFLVDKRAESIFDIQKCSKAPASFDAFIKAKKSAAPVDFNSLSLEQLSGFINSKSKLNWLSNKYIRHISISELSVVILPYIESDNRIPDSIKQAQNEQLNSILSSIRVYLNRLPEAAEYIAEFFVPQIEFESEQVRAIIDNEQATAVARAFVEQLKQKNPMDAEEFKEMIAEVGKQTAQKGRNLFMPIRIFTTGKSHGLELPVLFSLLGRTKIQNRMVQVGQLLGVEL